MRSCQEVQKFIHVCLDGELEETEWAAIRAHLDGCHACRRVASFEERFHELMRTGLRSQPAPPVLALRVRQALAAADQPHESWTRRWAWKLLPAAAAVALVVGVGLSRREDLSIVEQSIEWHRRHLPLDVTGSSPELIQRYFSDKVPFAVRPPRFPQRAQLVGARLANLREHQAVYVAYQVNGRRVSVFIFDPQMLTVDGAAPEVPAGPRKVRWRGLRGYNTLMYTSGGTGYAVTSEMDQQGLVQLVSTSP